MHRKVRKLRFSSNVASLTLICCSRTLFIMKNQVTVHLRPGSGRSYDILIKSGALAGLPSIIRKRWPRRLVFVVTDTNVSRLYAKKLQQGFDDIGVDNAFLEVPPGEESKSIDIYYALVGALLESGIKRGSLIIALGGGVVGDLAGFAAATVMRGVDFVQVPTSLLAQVDSSVGGKVGIDHEAGKNLIGAFHQPSFVLIDPDVLRTLPEVEFRNGLAEVVKIAAALDAGFFGLLEEASHRITRANAGLLTRVIHHAISLKAAVVENDERESGLRKSLNLGHTIGHALEATSDFSIRHGEAVAMGLVAEAQLAVTAGFLATDDYLRLVRLLGRCGLPAKVPPVTNPRKFFRALSNDKKNTCKDPSFVLLRRIGVSLINVRLPLPMIQALVR
jgi:3-dehydroquinate synthase